MIEMPAYQNCPVCESAGKLSSWRRINLNRGWWEEDCSNYSHYCRFAQFRRNSFEDEKLYYIRWALKDFFCYTYAESAGTIVAGTYFYHNEFPRGESVQGPFQIWPDFMPDWDKLEQLNKKLKFYRTFQ